MMTRLLIALALIAAVLADDCPIYLCTAPNNACNANATYVSICTGNSTCNLNSGTSLSCTPNAALKTLDGACSQNSDCYSNLCVASKCNQGYRPGTPCVSSNQCYYRINTTDVTGCNNGQCAGLGSGSYCQTNTQCSPPLTCGPSNTCISPLNAGANCTQQTDCTISTFCASATKLCTARIAAGAVCDKADPNDENCVTNNICTPAAADGSTYKCIAAYSQGAGATCTADIHCGQGMNCSYSSTSVYSTCQTIPTVSSGKNCADGCNSNEVCKCNHNNGGGLCVAPFLGNPSGISSDYSDVANCALKCERNDIPCQANTCHNQACNAYKDTFNQDGSVFKNSVPSCVYAQYSQSVNFWPGFSYTCSSASFAQVSIFVALAGLFALLF